MDSVGVVAVSWPEGGCLEEGPLINTLKTIMSV